MTAHRSTLSRRIFLHLTAATTVPLLLAACAPADAPITDGEGGSTTQETVDVRYIAMDYDSRMQADTQEVMDAFKNSQDAVKATLEVVSCVSWPEGKNVLLISVSSRPTSLSPGLLATRR